MPAYDLFGEPVPVGKIHRSLSTDFMEDTLPSWLTASEAASVTNRDLTTALGSVEVEITNDRAGLYGPALATADYREIRFGMSGWASISGQNQLRIRFAEEPNEESDNGIAVVSRNDGENVELRYKDSGTETVRDLNWTWFRDGGHWVVELRIRPFENGVSIATGDGEQIVYQEIDAPYGIETYTPELQLRTESEGTAQQASLTQLWIDILHN